jgi:hypothetical protein
MHRPFCPAGPLTGIYSMGLFARMYIIFAALLGQKAGQNQMMIPV